MEKAELTPVKLDVKDFINEQKGEIG